jgi:hypothetical protein
MSSLSILYQVCPPCVGPLDQKLRYWPYYPLECSGLPSGLDLNKMINKSDANALDLIGRIG